MNVSYIFKHGIEYAIFHGKSVAGIDGKGPHKEFQIYLGRPIDKENLIFYSKKYSLFRFNIDTNKIEPLDDFIKCGSIDDYSQACHVWEFIKNNIIKNKIVSSINIVSIKSNNDLDANTFSFNLSLLNNCENSYGVDFGTTFFIYQVIKGIEYDSNVLHLFNVYSRVSENVVTTLIIYKLGYDTPYSKMAIWQKQNIISLLYPNLKLDSQRISEYLRAKGSDTLKLNIIKAHISYIKSVYDLLKFNICLDSTALDNQCNIYISRFYRHCNIKHNGFRIIVAIHIPTGLPLYYDIIAGNIIDQTILTQTIENLKHLGCKVNHFTGDAAFSNITTLEKLIFLDSIESFLTRMNANSSIFHSVVEQELEKLWCGDYTYFKFNNRFIRARKTSIDLIDKDNPSNTKKAYIYIYLDEVTRSKKIAELLKHVKPNCQISDEIKNKLKYCGVFILISIRDLTPIQALIEYYSRTSVEQFFDVFKNELISYPVRLHSEEAIQGHILLCFIASFLYMLIKKRLTLFSQSHININPKYSSDNLLECDPVTNIETDILEQDVSKKLSNTPVSSFFYELQGQKANVYVENKQLYNEEMQIITIIPTSATAQAKLYYHAFGLVPPLQIVYTNDQMTIFYDKDLPKNNIKQLVFADRLCKEDLYKIIERQNQIYAQQEFGTFDNFFAPWWEESNINFNSSYISIDCEGQNIQSKRGRGRPKGSLNQSTIARREEALNKEFGNLDDFLLAWTEKCDQKCTDTCTSTCKEDQNILPKRGRGRPKGSLNKTTIARREEALHEEFSNIDDFFSQSDINQIKSSTNIDSEDQNILPKRGRGRPKGSLNKKTIARREEALHQKFGDLDEFFSQSDINQTKSSTNIDSEDQNILPKRGRGRPKGSLNKKTLARREEDLNQ